MNSIDEMGELRHVQTLEGHTDRVWGLAWNPTNTNLLASCSGDKTVRIWEQSPSSASFHCKAVLEETHTRTIRSCAWSPSGNMLATASFDATTAIWENIGGDFECISTLEGHENEVKSVSWNAAGSLIATCGRDKSVWIWEVEPGNEFECVSVLQGHTQDVKMVQWHPTVDVLFSCSYDNSIKIWAEDGDDDWHCVQTLNEANSGHTSTVWALSFNASGDKMVTCSDDLTIKVWGTDSLHAESGDGFAPWKHLCTISGYHDRTIFSVHWSRLYSVLLEPLLLCGLANSCMGVYDLHIVWIERIGGKGREEKRRDYPPFFGYLLIGGKGREMESFIFTPSLQNPSNGGKIWRENVALPSPSPSIPPASFFISPFPFSSTLL